MHIVEAEREIAGETVKVKLCCEGADVRVFVGDTMNKIAFIEPYYLNGSVKWKLANGLEGTFTLDYFSTMLSNHIPSNVLHMISIAEEASRRPPPPPSAKNFNAGMSELGVPGGNSKVAMEVKKAIDQMRGLTLTEEYRAMGAYMLVRDRLTPMERRYPGINDSAVYEAVWTRVGYVFNRGNYLIGNGLGREWSQTLSYTDVAATLAAHGVEVKP
jgi:hypothetical protein